ncbi:hypothetical protein Tco_0336336 [Tanacetum coccineum]
MGSLASTHADLLPPRKRFRDSYSSEASIERNRVYPIETEVDMELGIGDGDDVRDHVKIDPREIQMTPRSNEAWHQCGRHEELFVPFRRDRDDTRGNLGGWSRMGMKIKEEMVMEMVMEMETMEAMIMTEGLSQIKNQNMGTKQEFRSREAKQMSPRRSTLIRFQHLSRALLDIIPCLDLLSSSLATEELQNHIVLRQNIRIVRTPPFNIDPMALNLGSLSDVIIGMDWLAKNHGMIVCDEKRVRIPYGMKLMIVQRIKITVKEKKDSPRRNDSSLPTVRDFPEIKEEHDAYLRLILELLKKEELFESIKIENLHPRPHRNSPISKSCRLLPTIYRRFLQDCQAYDEADSEKCKVQLG